MISESDSVPVIFTIFNRPESTRRAFDAIRAAKPKKLFVVADGPRADRAGEAEKCAQTRAIIDEVDWDCEVYRSFSETNLGCRVRVSSGITWAFGLVDRAIILEDDCMASLSFFRYCADLLDRYEHDDRVMMISGNNFLFGQAEATTDSYYFSRYPHVWGWATWRRAWEKYDHDLARWPEIRDRKLFDQYISSKIERYYWESIFQHVYDGHINSWAYPWTYSIWANSGLCITPSQNLVRNIGFGAEATHTKQSEVYEPLSSLDAEELSLPLTHPTAMLVSHDNDGVEAKLRAARSRGLINALNKYISAFKVLTKRTTGRGGWPHPGLLFRGG